MDYKEKLKEALNSDNTDYEVVRWIEQNFPELKESEGERIRKELIAEVKEQIDFIPAQDCRDKEDEKALKQLNKWLAWLEKQGEKHIDRELSNLLNRIICRFINDPNIPYSERDEVSKKIIPYVEQLEKQGQCRVKESAISQHENKTCKENNGSLTSKDERIRKEMIFYFKEEIPLCSIQEHADKMKEFIAWLERQEVERTKLELKAGNSYFCYKSRWERADSETFKKGLIYKCNNDGVLDNFIIKNPEQHFIEIKDERIAWLEKQGEQKTINKIHLGKKYKCIASPRYSAFMTGEIYKPEDKFLCSLMNFCSDCFEPIEDDEQKSDDKVKPKFKVGDYVVGKYISGYISEVRDDCYLLDYQGFSIDKQDSYHLWTIHDVKNGDILVDEDNNIGLYKEEKDDIYWESYIYLGCDGELRGFNIGGYHRNKNTKPATKEQCDALITKMKESGFIWDASIQCIIREYSYG